MRRTIADSLLIRILSAVLIPFLALSPLLANGAQESGTTSNGIYNPASDQLRINLPTLITELDRASPEIKAARQLWEAAKAIVPQVQTLPDPTVKLGYQRMPMREP
ncbi:MAG: hypothetical protein OEV51_06030, partial [Nitrospira sp.]|nr:hypothetical protein [Nitrospira sp.]